ncbi:uracil-DNA glycosylase [Mesohalobacter halotolerans]|uniref:Uracil-DNA glycosylase n=1 Tax=Mesohalobacter halotolerans TaxID=1883405 RepID=A0A4U5TT08_9FLAO|nr:uracil-DNA glycosylase [Mesohalobacter halotolerans]MBS3739416.1 uracil-DNA glycosylase [Psychroflexus sp.]TKS56418.1 uracil-DNA glycosylase [Mesohalobacter halotolerans]
MKVNIQTHWKNILKDEFKKPYFLDLVDFVKDEYQQYRCYPKGSDIFKAFELSPFPKVKAVIIGQDPYHGHGQAHGLCFSVQDGIPKPPSLENIFKALHQDTGKPIPQSGDLSSWAKQGVLLLNATLTVRAHEAGSHQGKGWETFTNAVITALSEHRENLVFMLWGGFAKRKSTLIDKQKHLVLTSGHPSPLSANRGYWFGHKHFSEANTYLLKHGKTLIDW